MSIARTAAIVASVPALVLVPLFGSYVSAQEATPTAYTCQSALPASPVAGTHAMVMGTPGPASEHDMGGMEMGIEVDQLYIDMMLPHHASIIAMAHAAQDRLSDERLLAIAESIIVSQTTENEELRGYREQLFGHAEPMPMDGSMMGMMEELMPGLGNTDDMALMMDPGALVAAFCAAENADLAFIDLTIPHHEMAIVASETALDAAVHDEVREVAERVIADQRREIEELTEIREDLSEEGTPAA